MRKRITYAERKFTKSQPCSKIDIYNCFYGVGSTQDDQGRSSDITRARAIIGRNVVYRLCQAGHAELTILGGISYIALTDEGMAWLNHGVKRYLKNQPEKARDIEVLPRHWRRRFLKTVAK